MTNEFTYRFKLTPTRIRASADSGSNLMHLRFGMVDRRRNAGPPIEHAFPAQRVLESLGVLGSPPACTTSRPWMNLFDALRTTS